MYCGLNMATPSAARLPVRALPVRQRLSQACFTTGASLSHEWFMKALRPNAHAVKDQRSEIRDQKSEIRNQKSEIRNLARSDVVLQRY